MTWRSELQRNRILEPSTSSAAGRFQLNNDLGVSLSGRLFGVSLSGRLFVAGANTPNASVIALGVTWSPL